MAFNYQKLVRDETTYEKRHYVCPESNLLIPSVTTILDATADKTFLIEWRKRIGNAAADQQVKYASNLGTLVHEHMECHILGTERPSRSGKPIFQLAAIMADKMIKEALPGVTTLYGSEVGLYYPALYAGTTDLVGEHHGEQAIMDFKNSKKIKKKEQITDYFCQCAAYAHAHNYLYGTEIRKIVIMMIDRDTNYEEFIVKGAEFDHFSDIWFQRLEQYHENKK
jgi:genome maintenance exonuclease 1